MTSSYEIGQSVEHRDHSDRVLSVVIPALDEEEAIGQTIRRCLDAERVLVDRGVFGRLDVIVVSDGSTDNTEAIARSFPEVTVLAFDKNRGYGAAIKCGFEHAAGELLAFLDADGTCDPLLFGDLIDALDQQQADVVLGSRMGPNSEMPFIRSVGNRLFAFLLSALSLRSVRDTASGMRVIRRDCLKSLYPLPDGLHFTPAMSARILLEGRLKLIETPIPYAERVGRSKLSVVRDGIRFLTIIVQAAVTFRPARPLLMLAIASALVAGLIGLGPVLFYLRHARLEEWVIYRILLASLLATASGLLLCGAVIADRIASTAHGRWASTKTASWLHRAFSSRGRVLLQSSLIAAALLLVRPGILEYVATAHVQMHWSRAVLGSLLVVACVMLGLTSFLLRMMDLIDAQRARISISQPPDRLRTSAPPAGPALRLQTPL
jgi:glycosyltransferase involved in cell wall biosynthesis